MPDNIHWDGGRLITADNTHKKIAAAILAGKARDAKRLMRAHVTDGLKMLEEMPSEYFD